MACYCSEASYKCEEKATISFFIWKIYFYRPCHVNKVVWMTQMVCYKHKDQDKEQ